MAVTINASTSAGLVNTADTSGVLQLQTAGTTALSISAAQVVTLTNALPVASGGSGVTTSTGTGANVLGTTPSFTSTIGVGGATASASGSGISFPATQSASSNANTLDDYEEGTFTPTIVGVSTVGTASYGVQIGKYTKIGDRVLINIYLQWTGGTGTGNMDITGLPFSSESSVSNQSFSNYNSAIAMTAGHVMQLITGASSTFINVNSIPTGGGSDVNVPYDSAGLIIVGGSYRAA